MTAKLLLPILAIEECSGIAVTIPAGAIVDYEVSNVVTGVADLQWHGQTYFANVDEVVEASTGRAANRLSKFRRSSHGLDIVKKQVST